MANQKLTFLYLLAFNFVFYVQSNAFEVNEFGTESQKEQFECMKNPSDIVLVLDSSSSIWPPYFKKQLQFAKDLVDQLDIGMGQTQTRMGIISFGNWAQIEINLYESGDKDELKRTIDNIRQLMGDTNTGDALQLLKNEAFKKDLGSRSWVRHIGIVLTDAESQNKTRTQLMAQACKDSKIKLFAIGIGEKVSHKELRGIASLPKSKYLMFSPSYDVLDRIKHDVIKRACQKVTPEPKLSTTTKSTTYSTSTQTTLSSPASTDGILIADEACRHKVADVFFLLDSSSSISIEEFGKQINVIENLIKKFDIGSSKMRVGVSVFSHEYYLKLKFNDGSSIEEILDIVKNIEYLGGGTKIGEALHQVRINEFNETLVRHEAEKIIIMFTDGQSADPDRASYEAKLLKNAGVKLFVVGIGSFVNQIELVDIASRPSEDFVHTFKSFDELLMKTGILSAKACTVKDQILLREQEVCTATQLTDVMFMVSNNHFGQWKTSRILKAAAEVIRRIGIPSAFRFGTLFDECLPKQGVKIRSATKETQLVSEIVSFRHGSISSLVQQLRAEDFSWNSIRKIGLLFLDNTIELDGPLIQFEVKRALVEGIQFYVVAIGDGVDTDSVEKFIVPKERIITIESYDNIVTSLPFRFTDEVCVRGSNSGGFKPILS